MGISFLTAMHIRHDEVSCHAEGDAPPYSGVIYRNHPTPSGMDRSFPVLSTQPFFPTEQEAIDHMQNIVDKVRALPDLP